MTAIPPSNLDQMQLEVMSRYVDSLRSAIPVMTGVMSSLTWLRNNPLQGEGGAEWNAWVKKAHDNSQLFAMGLNSYVETAQAAERYLSPG